MTFIADSASGQAHRMTLTLLLFPWRDHTHSSQPWMVTRLRSKVIRTRSDSCRPKHSRIYIGSPFIVHETYTSTAGTLEHRVLQSTASEFPQLLASDGREWTFKTDHMFINLGSRLWGLHTPSYGLNGKIEGSVKFFGEQHHVDRVTATLGGKVTTTITQNGALAGHFTQLLLSRTITIYASYSKRFPWDRETKFTISFPTEVHTEAGTSQLPPSCSTRLLNIDCDIAYTLKLDMVRKGLRRHESQTIPVLYLPKSSPTHHPLTTIPRPLGDSIEGLSNRVKTVKLSTSWPKGAVLNSPNVVNSTKSVYLSLPSPMCFASGESIPFNLTILCTAEPALASFLSLYIRLRLLKRTRIWTNGHREFNVRDLTLATAELHQVNNSTEGVNALKGVIQAGTAGRECSWRVDGVAEVQYMIQVKLHPPKEMSGNCPSFEHEEEVQITTDPWGTVERELMATGGIPTPALALLTHLSNLRQS